MVVFRKHLGHQETESVLLQQESDDSNMVLLEHSFRFDSPPVAHPYKARSFESNTTERSRGLHSIPITYAYKAGSSESKDGRFNVNLPDSPPLMTSDEWYDPENEMNWLSTNETEEIPDYQSHNSRHAIVRPKEDEDEEMPEGRSYNGKYATKWLEVEVTEKVLEPAPNPIVGFIQQAYEKRCKSILYEVENGWDYATSKLLIVLPSDLNSWVDSDPSTHHFRLYFLCDNKQGHLFSHEGYGLRQPGEFFRAYGEYVLGLLKMIKQGYSDEQYKVPPLHTFKILEHKDPSFHGGDITKDNIEDLVDKAIAYLQLHSPLTRKSAVGLTRKQSIAIKAYLDLPEDDYAEGNLFRYIDSNQREYWRCPSHTILVANERFLERLRIFVRSHGGHIDMRKATLTVNLRSAADAGGFQAVLRATNHIFDISIKLEWTITRSYVEKLCTTIAKTGAKVLEIDGITLDAIPQDYVQYTHNPIGEDVLKETTLRVVTLLNYPRPQEQTIHFKQVSLQSTIAAGSSVHRWVEQQSALNNFQNLISGKKGLSQCRVAAKELRSTLQSLGVLKPTFVTVYEDSWDAVFDLQKGVFVEAFSLDMECPEAILSSGSLRTITVDLYGSEIDDEFFHLMRANPGLQQLNISSFGHNLQYYFEHFVRMWHNASSTFRLTLIDRIDNTQGRAIVQMDTIGRERNFSADSALDVHRRDATFPICRQQPTTNIQFLRWDCDFILTSLSDYSASLMDMATQRHPSVLKLVTLDITRLSRDGLTSVRNILRRSRLEYLRIVCSSVDPSLSDSVAQVLDSVQWDTLKSLVLSGDTIDGWIQLWPPSVAPRLLYLNICGTGSSLQKLSHVSVLWIHQLVYMGTLAELHLGNFQLQNKSDWALIVESMDSSLLQTINLSADSAEQFISSANAIDTFTSSFESHAATIYLSAFTLDIVPLSQSDRDRIQNILSRSSVDHVRILCRPFHPSRSNNIAQVLHSMQWSTQTSLVLAGDSINEWIHLLLPISSPGLKHLEIHGARQTSQTLSHSSVLLVQKLICAGSLMELRLQDIQLQDTQDWVPIIKSKGSSLSLNLCKRSKNQLDSCTEATDILELDMYRQQILERNTQRRLERQTQRRLTYDGSEVQDPRKDGKN